MRRLADHLVAILVMAGGASLVFALLSWMNSYSTPPPKPEAKAATAMHVAPKPPPKQRKAKPRRRSTPKPKARSSRPRTPPPNLGSPLSGIALPGTAFDASANLGGLGETLIGDVDRRNVVMTADTVDEKPRPVRRVPPAFPPGARRRGITGEVVVRMVITAAGRVERVKVVRASPPGVFDSAALAAVRQWEYQPARQAGQPVKIQVQQTVRFQLTRGGLGG